MQMMGKGVHQANASLTRNKLLLERRNKKCNDPFLPMIYQGRQDFETQKFPDFSRFSRPKFQKFPDLISHQMQ